MANSEIINTRTVDKGIANDERERIQHLTHLFLYPGKFCRNNCHSLCQYFLLIFYVVSKKISAVENNFKINRLMKVHSRKLMHSKHIWKNNRKTWQPIVAKKKKLVIYHDFLPKFSFSSLWAF